MALVFRISTGSPTPIYRQIVDQVRHAAATGTQKPGDPLPSVRTLAEQLVINPNTVAKAYAELVRDGLVEARQGRGYFIGDRRQVYSKAERVRRLDQAMDTFLSESLALNFTPDELRNAIERKLARLAFESGNKTGKTDE